MPQKKPWINTCDYFSGRDQVGLTDQASCVELHDLGRLPRGQALSEQPGLPLPGLESLEHLRVGLDQKSGPASVHLEEEAVGELEAVVGAGLDVEAIAEAEEEAVHQTGLAKLTCTAVDKRIYCIAEIFTRHTMSQF